ncbi:MAG: hypothetical protein JWM19_7654 [Actinomycetia bacterium]|nr:hypothetical protein [Actinomycetes bacterium]
MMYLWTAPGWDESALRTASGVTDNASTARQAAETLLRTGQARSALVECAYTAMAARALSLRYVRTGTGWSGHVSQAGQVVWTAFARLQLPRWEHQGGGHRGDTLTAPSQAKAVGSRGGKAHRHLTSGTRQLGSRR